VSRALVTGIGQEPMPIIIGAPRSGTTLLRFMIESHPSIAIPPETGFLPYGAGLMFVPFAARKLLFKIVTSYPRSAPKWQDFCLDKQDFWNELQKIQPFDVSEGFRAFYRMYAQRQRKLRYGDKTPGYCKHIKSVARVLPEAHFIHIIRDGRDVALSLR